MFNKRTNNLMLKEVNIGTNVYPWIGARIDGLYKTKE